MTTSHGGFLIPNAEGSLSTKMAEPDQIDFNTIGNSRWGVVSGCLVIVVGTEAQITVAGIAVVDGVVVNVPSPQYVTLGAGGSQPRFDLIGVNSAGTIVSIPGSSSVDPVYPDVPTTVTLLASVFCPVGSATFDAYVSDKRNYLQPVFVSSVTGTTPVVLNRTGGSDTFRIDAAGRIEWNDSDTYLYRTSAANLRVHSNLTLDGTVNAGGNVIAAGDMTATGTLRGSNFIKLPDGSGFPSAPQGTLLQLNGRLYVQTAVTAPMSWEQVATAATSNQPGDIKQSMRSPAQMPGWLPMDGRPIYETEYPQLFAVDGLSSYIIQGSPRMMYLPDATDRILMPTQNNPGVIGGSSTILISLNNLPAHVHGVTVAANGAHYHTATLAEDGGHQHTTLATGSNGRHGHPVIDNGHAHNGAEGWGGIGGWAFVALAWGGRNKLDGPINDSSHTYSVEPMQWTSKATSDITIGKDGSEHQHQTDAQGSHGHRITINGVSTHTHTVTENPVGSNQPVTVTPKYLTVYTYVCT